MRQTDDSLDEPITVNQGNENYQPTQEVTESENTEGAIKSSQVSFDFGL